MAMHLLIVLHSLFTALGDTCAAAVGLNRPPFLGEKPEDRQRRVAWLVRVGFYEERRGRLDASERAYREASELEPDEPMHFFDLAAVLEKEGAYQSAAEHYERGLALGGGLAPRFLSEIENRLRAIRTRSEAFDHGPAAKS